MKQLIYADWYPKGKVIWVSTVHQGPSDVQQNYHLWWDVQSQSEGYSTFPLTSSKSKPYIKVQWVVFDLSTEGAERYCWVFDSYNQAMRFHRWKGKYTEAISEPGRYYL